MITLEIDTGLIKLVVIDNYFGKLNIRLSKILECEEISSINTITNIEKVSKLIKNEISNIKLPNGLVNIVDYAFKYNKLKNVEIPNSVISIGSSTFSENPNLTSIKIDKENGSIEGAPWGANNATITWLR